MVSRHLRRREQWHGKFDWDSIRFWTNKLSVEKTFYPETIDNFLELQRVVTTIADTKAVVRESAANRSQGISLSTCFLSVLLVTLTIFHFVVVDEPHSRPGALHPESIITAFLQGHAAGSLGRLRLGVPTFFVQTKNSPDISKRQTQFSATKGERQQRE